MTEISKHFDKIAKTYEQAAVLPHEIASRLDERLDYVKIKPKLIVDLGCNTGRLTQLVNKRYPKAKTIAMDISEAMLQFVKLQYANTKNVLLAANANYLPFQDQSIDLLVSNLVFQWCDLKNVFKEIQRVLKPGGLFLFSIYGPDTLQELRASWAQVDQFAHVNQHLDMHDVGDLLLQARLLDPVMDAEILTLQYQSVEMMLQELKNQGSKVIHPKRNYGLTNKYKLKKMMQYYTEHYSQNNLILASFEIIYGHAWGTNHTDDKLNHNNEVLISIDKIGRFHR